MIASDKKEMNLLVISCSLNPDSNSRIMGKVACETLGSADWLDLRDHDMPLCDGAGVYSNEVTAKLTAKVEAADGILMAVPIYNYDLNAATKNLLELTGKAWTDKVVGFVVAAGGQGSYMAVMPFANSLMLDYRCTIVPRFVYATGDSFQGNELADADVKSRLEQLAKVFAETTAKLRG